MMEIARNRTYFPNGSAVETITTGTSNGATPPVYSGVITAVTISPAPDGAMPPGVDPTGATVLTPGAPLP